ncbi:carbohydrate-binding protein [Streptomyces sp. NPDC002454]
MTAGDNGSKPADDDPFGYLYADGQAAGATPPSGGGGYGYPGPRSSYHQVRPVGERQYKGPQQQYAQQPPAHGQVPPQQPPYGQPPYGQQQVPPGPPAAHGGPGGGRGRGPNTRGILIGAIAVLAAVVVGIGVVVLNGKDDDKTPAGADSTPSAPAQGGDEGEEDKAPKGDGDEKTPEPGELPRLDAKALKQEGGVTTSTDVSGAKAAGGVYVTGFNKVGAAVTWTLDDIVEPGKYTVFVGYTVPGKDANATITVNGTAQTRPFSLKNYANASDGDRAKGWTESYGYVELNKGTNTVKLSCEEGNQCDADLDRVWLAKGWVTRG